MKKREEIQERLASLVNNGTLTPERVVLDARDPNSPLHGEFEWDDSKAAASHRLDQARRLISSVRVRIVEESRVLEAIAYVRDPDAAPNEQGYTSVVELRSDEERARKALLNEISIASAYIARVRSLSKALGFDGAVELIERDMALLQEKVQAA